MLVRSGGGSIVVAPATLEAMAARIIDVTNGTSSARGSFAATAGAGAGCADPAGPAYDQMHQVLGGALAFLAEYSGSLGHATGAAAQSYVSTDNAQMTTSAPGCTAVP